MNKLVALVSVILVITASTVGIVIYMNGHNSDNDTITVTDMLGESVEVKKNPEHVACVSRTTYDLLVAFGLGDRIDGAYAPLFDNDWTAVLYPDSSRHYAYGYEPSHELLVQRNVDLVFCPEKYITDGLKEHGIAALNVSLYGNPKFESYVFFLADLAKTLWPDVEGVSEKVDAWKAEFQTVIDEVKDTLSTKGYPEKTVYYVRGDKNRGINYTDTGKSFNEYIFELLGTKYLGNTMGKSQPSTEAILEADPQIIVMGGIYQHTLKNVLVTDATWENVSAVKTNSIYNIGIGFSPMEQMGVFSPVFLADMANKLYPDDFHYDTTAMLKALCQNYFGITLTDQQANYMLNGLGPDGNPMA